MIKTKLFLLFIVIFNAQIGAAETSEHFEYVHAVLQSRVDYNQKLVQFFSDETKSVEEKKQVYFELTGHELRGSLDFIVQSALGNVKSYQEALKISQQTYFDHPVISPLKLELGEIFNLTPELKNELTQVELETQLLRYICLYASSLVKKLEFLAQKTQAPKCFLVQEKETGYSEIGALQDLLDQLKHEVSSSWWNRLSHSVEMRDNGTLVLGAFTDAMNNLLAVTIKIAADAELLPKVYESQPDRRIQAEHLIELSFKLYNKYDEFHDLSQRKAVRLVGFTNSQNLDRNKKIEVKHLINLIGNYTFFEGQLRLYPVLVKYEAMLDSVLEDIYNYKNNNKKTVKVLETPKKKKKRKRAKSKNKAIQVFGKNRPRKNQELIPPLTETEAESDGFQAPITQEQNLEVEADSNAQESLVSEFSQSEPQEEISSLPKPEEESYAFQAEEKLNEKGERAKLREIGKKEREAKEPPSHEKSDEKIFSSRHKKFLSRVKANLSNRYKRLIQRIYDNETNHHTLRYDELENLIIHLGGRLTQNGTSHVRITIPGGTAYSFKPHGKSHDSKVPQICVLGFRSVLEMAGITPELFE